MNKLVTAAALLAFLAGGVGAEWGREGKRAGDKSYKKHGKHGKGEHPEYKKPVVVKAIGFRAREEDGAVKLSWKRYKRSDFLWYKLMRGDAENPDPLYPDDNAIFFTETAKETNFVDEEAEPGVNFYRLCVITKHKNRWVSPVIAVNVGGGAGAASAPDPSDFE